MEKLKYKKYGKKYFIQHLFLSIPLLILFVIAWSHWETLDLIFWSCIGLFMGSIVTGIIWDKRKFKNFHCPECGNLIAEPTIKDIQEYDPINYYCPDCDIEWETGLSVPGTD